MYEKAASEPSQALLRLLCYILCDDGTLLDTDPDHHTQAENALNWKRVHQYSEELYAMLSARKQTAVLFSDALERLKQFRPSTDEMKSMSSADKQDALQSQVEKIQKSFRRIFRTKELPPQFSELITELLNLSAENPDLARIKPLFLYRVLTIHRSRMLQGALDLRRLDYRALWSYKEYKIDDDNGKNHRIYMKYLELFGMLYHLFAGEETVDVTLCLYGFDHLSNLGDFYRQMSPDRKNIPLDVSVEDWLLDHMCVFSCYEYGEGDNILLDDSGLSVMKLERFQSGKNPRWKKALGLVEQYFNHDLESLTTRFLDSDPGQVRALCREILECSKLPNELQPQDETETALFLAAINSGLMESADNFANAYLMEACHLLTGEISIQKLNKN